MSKEVVTGLNILKKGQDPPLPADDQLPKWLWKLAEPEKTLNELRRMQPDDLTPQQVRADRGPAGGLSGRRGWGLSTTGWPAAACCAEAA